MEVTHEYHTQDITNNQSLCKSEFPVTVAGWIDRIQYFKNHVIIILRDGTGYLQVISDDRQPLNVESYILITGYLKDLPPGYKSYHPFELHTKKITLISSAKDDFSSRCPSDSSSNVKLEQRHLYIRDETFSTYIKLRSLFVDSIRKHFKMDRCVEIFPPSLVGNQCEGGSTLFKLDYMGKEAYLTQSSQFYLEYSVPGVGNCYCISPSFRAEKSHTRRHLTEFLHAEAEWKNVNSLEEHLTILKKMFRSILSKFGVKVFNHFPEFKIGNVTLFQRINDLLNIEIITMTHREAIEYCRQNNIYKGTLENGDSFHFDDRDDIPEAQERTMVDKIGKIVLLTKFPREFKSFYMATCPEDSSLVQGCDVEVPGVGEIIGSGVRVSDPIELIQRLKEQNLSQDDYKEYIDMRLYGHSKTSGMGLGIDRFLTWILDLNSIREVVTFPRYPGKLTP